jgi:hypothetical protein
MLMHASQKFFIMLQKLRKLRRALLYYPTAIKRRAALAGARWLLSGESAWTALEQLNVPGFGADLIRIDFPPTKDPRPRHGHGKPLHPELEHRLESGLAVQEVLLARCLAVAEECLTWPEQADPRNASLPWRDNTYMTLFDMVAAYGIISEAKPRSYLEIGSGVSTRVAYQARRAGDFPMQIVSVDPCPRVEVERLCDRVLRKRLEDSPVAEFVDSSGPGTVVFFDGSHRCFPGSDVTVFFLEILPKLKSGTLVHIHDIYLPADYPAWAGQRYWSEQYLLAAYLLGGADRVQIVMPCYYMGLEERCGRVIADKLGKGRAIGSSFWMRITD